MRRLSKNQIKRDYNDYLIKIQNELVLNSKQFWKFIKEKNGLSSIPGCVKFNDQDYNEPVAIANIFAQYFSSVYENTSNKAWTGKLNGSMWPTIYLKNISEKEISTVLAKIKNSSVSGLDNIPAYIIKDCRSAFLKPLHYIYNLCIKTGVFPDIWKQAKITPIHKNGDKNLVVNYRPIVLLCNFSKIFESILYSNIYPNIKRIISSKQHGFMTGRSTVSNLLCLTQDITEAFDSRTQLDVVYTDFQKAFDKVDHNILIEKLHEIGFSSQLVQLLESFLLNRKHLVQFNGFISEKFTPTSGIPQGSNLGPLLFNIFINDVQDVIFNSNVLMYADDLKIYKQISCMSDSRLLQGDLDRLGKWCENNNMFLNVAKCHVLTFNKIRNVFEYNYELENKVINRCNQVKDLGITFEQNLSFRAHLENITKSALKSFGFVMRQTKDFTNTKALKSLYFAFVRSKLEYAGIIWNPYYTCHKMCIENIQRKFLKYLSFKVYGNYPRRGTSQLVLLDQFQMVSLYCRRQQAATIFIINLLCNKIECPELLEKILFKIPNTNLRKFDMLYYTASTTNYGNNTPIKNMIKNFNRICSMIDLDSYNKKKTLDFVYQIYKSDIK